MADKDMTPNQSMEDLLASIRRTVEQEAGGADAPAADDMEPAEPVVPVEAQATEQGDDILDLTEMLDDPDQSAEESADGMVDIEAFNEGAIQPAALEKVAAARAMYRGETTEQGPNAELEAVAALMGEPKPAAQPAAPAPAAPLPEQAPVEAATEEADVDIDALMAAAAPAVEEVAPAQAEQPAVTEPEAETDADWNDNELADDVDADEGEASDDDWQEPEDETAEGTDDLVHASVEEMAAMLAGGAAANAAANANTAATKQKAQNTAAANGAAKRVNLATVPTATGLQVAFPAEILAEALRPLVSDWISENLPDIVERLVREELSKLADN